MIKLPRPGFEPKTPKLQKQLKNTKKNAEKTVP